MRVSRRQTRRVLDLHQDQTLASIRKSKGISEWISFTERDLDK